MDGKSQRTVSQDLLLTPDQEAILDALGDRTRRLILQRLRRQPMAVVDIARDMPVSRPAVSQHLKVLKEAGLVIDRADATRRIYTLDPQGLSALRGFLEGFWADALSNFADLAERRSPTMRP